MPHLDPSHITEKLYHSEEGKLYIWCMVNERVCVGEADGGQMRKGGVISLLAIGNEELSAK